MRLDDRDESVGNHDQRWHLINVCCPRPRHDEASGMVGGGLLIGCCAQHSTLEHSDRSASALPVFWFCPCVFIAINFYQAAPFSSMYRCGLFVFLIFSIPTHTSLWALEW